MNHLIELSDYVQNTYGNIYSKSGKGVNQVGGMNVKKFSKQILGNRVLDLYLKYTGLKSLNSATLVPFAFILGKEYLEKILTEQTGGGSPLPTNIPLLDHPIAGLYLKLIGLSIADLTTGALVPLGSLMILHDLYSNSNQSGGSRTLMGNSVPSNIIQNIDSMVRGQGMIDNILHIPDRLPEVNNNLQLACSSGACSSNSYHSEPFTAYNSSNNLSPVAAMNNADMSLQTNIPYSMTGGGNTFDTIINPTNGLTVPLNSKQGANILNNYLKLFK